MGYDIQTGLALVSHDGDAVLVDTLLCVDSPEWAQENKQKILVVGHVDWEPVYFTFRLLVTHLTWKSSKDHLTIPPLPPYVSGPNIDSQIVVRALLVTSAERLDLSLWKKTVLERQTFDLKNAAQNNHD